MMVTMIFKPAARYPADPRAVFILALSVFSGITALVLQAAPESLEAVLPRWGVITWGVSLGLGSLVTLIGMARQTVNGIVIEQIGSVMVGAATIFYSILAIVERGPAPIQTVGIVLAWGLSSLVRWAQLQSLIHDSVKRAEKRAFLEAFEAEVQRREAERATRRGEESRDLLREWHHH